MAEPVAGRSWTRSRRRCSPSGRSGSARRRRSCPAGRRRRRRRSSWRRCQRPRSSAPLAECPSRCSSAATGSTPCVAAVAGRMRELNGLRAASLPDPRRSTGTPFPVGRLDSARGRGEGLEVPNATGELTRGTAVEGGRRSWSRCGVAARASGSANRHRKEMRIKSRARAGEPAHQDAPSAPRECELGHATQPRRQVASELDVEPQLLPTPAHGSRSAGLGGGNSLSSRLFEHH